MNPTSDLKPIRLRKLTNKITRAVRSKLAMLTIIASDKKRDY